MQPRVEAQLKLAQEELTEFEAKLKEFWWTNRNRLVLIPGGGSDCGKSALSAVLLGVLHYRKNEISVDCV